MGFVNIDMYFSLTRDQFVHLLLLNGAIDLLATPAIPSDADAEKIKFNGLRNHRKFGTPGKDDANHYFETEVLFRGRYFIVCPSLRSQDGGQTFEGSFTIHIYPDDNLSE